MSSYAMERGYDRIAEIASRGHDVVTFWREATEIVGRLVPNFQGPCCYTLDPATLLITSHFNPAMYYELPEEMLRAEYYEEDVHDLASVARSESGISTIHDAADGDPSSSPRWRANMDLGGDQELLVALRTRAGYTWGALGLYRAPGEKSFSSEQLMFMRTIAPLMGEGLKLALLVGERASRTRRSRPACSYSPRSSSSSPPRPAASAGSTSSRVGAMVSASRRLWFRWRRPRCAAPMGLAHQARWRLRESSRSPVGGSRSTARRSRAGRRHVSRSSSSPPTRRGSRRS